MRDLEHAVAWPELAEWIRFLRVDERKADKTIYNYTRQVGQLLLMHPDTAFVDFTTDQVRDLLAVTSDKSLHITKSILRGWFRWGVTQDKLDRNPVDKIGRSRAPQPRSQPLLSDLDISQLEALPSPDGPLCTILLGTGIRKAGARGLRRDHVDLDREMLTVTEKGSKTREVWLPPEVQAAVAKLDLLEGLGPQDYVFSLAIPGIPNSRMMGDTTMDTWWRSTCDKAGVTRRGVHATRQTYAHRVRGKDGIQIDVLQKLMGHKNVQTTINQYGHLTAEDAAEALKKVW